MTWIVVAQLQEQVELLGEKGVVVLHGKAEQGIGLAEGSAPDDDLGASFRDEVEGREFLKDAHRIGGAQHGDGAGQADSPVRAAAAARITAGAESRNSLR